MPRVNTATKNKAGKEVQCGRCGKKIEPKEKYYHFKFRYGGKHYRCSAHFPRPSELTQSKMSGVYAAIEGAEDSIAEIRAGKAPLTDLSSDLESTADEVESVRDEYQESLENMPEPLQGGPTGEEIQEKIDALETFAEELRSAASDIESDSSGETEPQEKETKEEAEARRRDELCDQAEEALSNLSV